MYIYIYIYIYIIYPDVLRRLVFPGFLSDPKGQTSRQQNWT